MEKELKITYERFREKYKEELDVINRDIEDIKKDKMTDASNRLYLQLSFDNSLEEIEKGSGIMDTKTYNKLKRDVEFWLLTVKRLQREKDEMIEQIKQAKKKYEEKQRKYEALCDI
jgi:hypothetical protein